MDVTDLEDQHDDKVRCGISERQAINSPLLPRTSEDISANVSSNIGSYRCSPFLRIFSEKIFGSSSFGYLCFGIAGIYGSFLYHGVLEEDLFRFRGEKNSNFHFVWFMQVAESAIAICIGVSGRLLAGSNRPANLKSVVPFLQPGVSQVFAKAFTYLSLAAGVSFPVVVLAKSAKIVPVMLGQLILGKSQYGFRDYMFALLIVCETVLLSGGETALTPGSSTIGLLLIAASLVMDGVTAGLQKRILNNTKNAPLTSFDFLLFTNFSMVTVAVVISVLTGDFVNGWQFIQNNPAALKLLLKCCLFSAVGQSFIYYVVATFDPLVCSTITTTRKIFSVLLSIIFKGHILNDRGRAGLVFALAGLAIEIEHKLSSTQRHKNNNKDLGTVSSSNLSDSMSSDSPFVRSQRCVRQRTASPGGAES